MPVIEPSSWKLPASSSACDALAHREAAGGALARDLLFAAHLLRERLALPQLFEFPFPAHGGARSRVDIGAAC